MLAEEEVFAMDGADARTFTGCRDARDRHGIAARWRQGITVAVLGSGIDLIYPRSNLQLSEEICLQGTRLSVFPLQTPPRRENFPRPIDRNIEFGNVGRRGGPQRIFDQSTAHG